MSILVTGGAGYIGSHTVVELLMQGHSVVVLDNFSNAQPQVLDRIRQITGRDFGFYEADLRNPEQIEAVFAENDLTAVVHFAGLKAVGESVRKPLEYYDNNVTGTLNLCRAMTRYGCKRMVFSSSATVPFVESQPLSTTNPYGTTKLMIEQILQDLYAADPQWSIALLRYFNPIGAHQSGLIGESPNGIPNNLLPYVAQVAVGKLPFVSVYGNDYDTPDGTGVRDYIHVTDLTQGHLDALRYITGTTGVEAINLGTGKGTSVLEVIAAFEAASGVNIPYKIVERRPGDIATSYAGCQKAKELLGWQAKLDIARMCEDSWRFISGVGSEQ